MNIDKELIQKLRATTGVGIMDAKKALQETDGDFDKAIELMKKQGQKIAAKKQDRATNEGTIGTYIHSNGKVVGIAVVACESDFVEKTEDFKELAHNIAMQVAATDPIYISSEDVPADILAKEKEIFTEQLKSENKPANVMENIIKGKIQKYYSEVCLLNQPFIKDDKLSIEQLIQEKVLKLGENIKVKEIKKISL